MVEGNAEGTEGSEVSVSVGEGVGMVPIVGKREAAMVRVGQVVLFIRLPWSVFGIAITRANVRFREEEGRLSKVKVMIIDDR